MRRQHIPLIRLMGIPIALDTSWIILAALISWTLAANVFPFMHPHLSQGTYWTMGIVGMGLLLTCIVLHELSHALVARHYGVQTKDIVLFVFGGVSEMQDEPPSPKAEFWIALAGPIASLVLAGVLWLVSKVGQLQLWGTPVVGVLAYLSTVNFVVAVFNLLPAFPLDGGRIFRALLWAIKHNLQQATHIASDVGLMFGAGMIIAGLLNIVFAGDIVGGAWWVVLGLFLRRAASLTYQALLIKQLLADMPISQFIRTNPVCVSPDVTLSHLVEQFFYGHYFKMYPVVSAQNQLIGVVRLDQVKAQPKEQWSLLTVADVMQRDLEKNAIDHHQGILTALDYMTDTGNTTLLVVDEQKQLIGLLSTKDILHYLSVHLALPSKKSA